jgi:hypothetical protein
MDLQKRARDAVKAYILPHLEVTDDIPEFETYIVWFTKTLQNWKALVSTTLPDQMHYELTYNGDKDELYIDAYKKFNNSRIEKFEASYLPSLTRDSDIIKTHAQTWYVDQLGKIDSSHMMRWIENESVLICSACNLCLCHADLVDLTSPCARKVS